MKVRIAASKTLNLKSIILEDDTQVVLSPHKIMIAYPKKKFSKPFKEQIANRKKEYIIVEWSDEELGAIIQGLDAILKEREAQKALCENRNGGCICTKKKNHRGRHICGLCEAEW